MSLGYLKTSSRVGLLFVLVAWTLFFPRYVNCCWLRELELLEVCGFHSKLIFGVLGRFKSFKVGGMCIMHWWLIHLATRDFSHFRYCLIRCGGNLGIAGIIFPLFYETQLLRILVAWKCCLFQITINRSVVELLVVHIVLEYLLKLNTSLFYFVVISVLNFMNTLLAIYLDII